MAALPTRDGSGLTRTLGGYGALMAAKAELERVKREEAALKLMKRALSRPGGILLQCVM